VLVKQLNGVADDELAVYGYSKAPVPADNHTHLPRSFHLDNTVGSFGIAVVSYSELRRGRGRSAETCWLDPEKEVTDQNCLTKIGLQTRNSRILV
jgi:hypothetical protein